MKRFFRRLRFWLFQRGKHCKHCCLFCGFYDFCSFDIAEELATSFKRIGTAAANANCSIERFAEALKKQAAGTNSRRP